MEWLPQTITVIILKFEQCEPSHDKTNKMTYAPHEDPDQPGRPPSLNRVFAVRMKNHLVLSYSLSALRREIRGLSESWLGAHAILLVVVRRLICGFTIE